MKIIFVYNADSSLFSSITDFAHKIVSPKTYECNLCKLSYGNFNMKKEWADFVNSLDERTVFLHRNEWYKAYPSMINETLPAVFSEFDEKPRLIISAKELIELVNIALQN